MSSCDKVVGPGGAGVNMAMGQGCACVYIDAATGSLMVDGVPFSGVGGNSGPVSPTTGILAGSLNSAVTISPAQLLPGVLPAGVQVAAGDVTGLCAATLACLTPGSISPTALGAGSLPSATKVDAASITPGTVAGTVLTSTGTGTVWAAPAATPVGGPISPTSSGISSGALNPAVTIDPSQLQPGSIPAGTTIDAAQVSGTLPNSAIPCAAVVACVAAAPSGTITADKIGPGALQSGVTIQGTSVLGGTAGEVLVSDGVKGVWTTPAAGGAPATAETLGGSVLKSTVTVPAAQITGVLGDAQIPCTAVAACVSAMPVGSIPANKLAPGTTGQVLSTNASGATVWATPAAPTGQQVATAMNSATAITSPAGAGSIAQVYGENAAGAPITAGPKQVFEAGMADSPLSTTANPVAAVSGIDASGAEVRTTVQKTGTKTASTDTPYNGACPTGTDVSIAKVTAPENGLYAITVSYSHIVTYAGSPALGTNYNRSEWYVATPAGRPYDVILNDPYTGASATGAGGTATLAQLTQLGGIVYLNAGQVAELKVYANSASAPYSLNASGSLILTKMASNELLTPA